MKPQALPFTHGGFVSDSLQTPKSIARRSVSFVSSEARGEINSGDKGVGSVGMHPKAEAPLRVRIFDESLHV